MTENYAMGVLSLTVHAVPAKASALEWVDLADYLASVEARDSAKPVQTARLDNAP
ncbi:hypothetical protein [Humisphaera borealis]|uniref:Uncharacterized protein n=1 Tax=Humisphaera borealis TaxID=2807512 RepID=A0A7M2WSS3_9BACT|nr:hypothetical protein [Humisphaera borealis]QOV88469.1 hypothetical protein IPV69_19790 [Humisphaera borealis]